MEDGAHHCYLLHPPLPGQVCTEVLCTPQLCQAAQGELHVQKLLYSLLLALSPCLFMYFVIFEFQKPVFWYQSFSIQNWRRNSVPKLRMRAITDVTLRLAPTTKSRLDEKVTSFTRPAERRCRAKVLPARPRPPPSPPASYEDSRTSWWSDEKAPLWSLKGELCGFSAKPL